MIIREVQIKIQMWWFFSPTLAKINNIKCGTICMTTYKGKTKIPISQTHKYICKHTHTHSHLLIKKVGKGKYQLMISYLWDPEIWVLVKGTFGFTRLDWLTDNTVLVWLKKNKRILKIKKQIFCLNVVLLIVWFLNCFQFAVR